MSAKSIPDKPKIRSILEDSAVSAYTEIACVSIRKNLNAVNRFKEFKRELRDSEDTLLTSMGKKTITLLIHEEFLSKVKKFFSKEIQDIDVGLGLISIKCPKEVNVTPMLL